MNLTLFNYKDDKEPFVKWVQSSAVFQNLFESKSVYLLRMPVGAKQQHERGLAGLHDLLARFAKNIDISQKNSPYLFVDHSNEGPAAGQIIKTLAQFADQKSIARANIVYVSQNRALVANFFDHKLDNTRSNTIKCLPFDYHLHRFIDYAQSNRDKFDSILARTATVDRLFLCTNMRPRPHKIAAMAMLTRPAINHLSLVSSRYEDDKHPAFDIAVDIAADNFPKQAQRIAEFRETLDSPKFYLPGEGDKVEGNLYSVPRTACLRTAIWLVTETGFSSGKIDRITEKSLKAIATGHPLIVVGEPGSLKFLKRFGFDIAYDGIDKGYDDIGEPDERMEAIGNAVNALIDRRQRMGPKFHQELLASPVIRRNQNHLFSKLKPALLKEADDTIASWDIP